jgi:nitrate/nitrite-specific signal transduction histidine kinase
LALHANRFSQEPLRLIEGRLAEPIQIRTRDELEDLADAFNQMAAELARSFETLEEKVADRTRALAISAEVSRRLSTLLDQQQLVSEVVEQLQTAFNYYHVHIYLWDEKRENLVMVGGTGEAGRIMLGRGHQIPKGRGLVGRAADTNLTVLVTDVSKEAGWLPNPLLPETKAEVAVPIALGERVLGVLDVQHNMVSGLRQEDAELIQSVANQVAIGLQNIRAYVKAQQQAQREALVGAIGQKIQSAANVETAMQIAVREVGRALGGARVGVRLKAGGPTNGHDHESPNTEEVR